MQTPAPSPARMRTSDRLVVTDDDLAWLESRLHSDTCRQCALVQELIRERRERPAVP